MSNIRNIIGILFLFIILGMEQALGLPSIFVVSVLFMAQGYKGYGQLLFLIFIGLSLAVFYELALSLVVIVILFAQLVVFALAPKIKSEGFRVLLSAILVLGFFLFKISFSFSLIFIIAHNFMVLSTSTLILFILRRRRKTLSLSERVA